MIFFGELCLAGYPLRMSTAVGQQIETSDTGASEDSAHRGPSKPVSAAGTILCASEVP